MIPQNGIEIRNDLIQKLTRFCNSCWMETNIAFNQAKFERLSWNLWCEKYSLIIEKSEYQKMINLVVDSKDGMKNWLKE